MKKTTAKKINVRLLRAIGAKALAYPETSNLNLWGSLAPIDEDHPCGAVACIAGTAVLLESRKKFLRVQKRHLKWLFSEPGEQSPFFVAAASRLGLTGDQAERLFMPAGWPARLLERYQAAFEPADRALILNERIELFIKTKGAE